MSLTFQRSFKLELDNVAKILEAVVEMPFASRNEIADFTGIPIGKSEIHGKVDPTLLYATFSGLITTVSDKNSKKRTLTDFGRVVYENDKRLRHSETRWGMHYFLSASKTGAPAWIYFTHHFLPSKNRFSREDLNYSLQAEFRDLSSRYVNENERTLLQCYTEYGALGKIGLIEHYGKESYIRGSVNYPSPYLAAYLLAETWEAKHPDKLMVSPDVLSQAEHLSTTLNLNDGDLQNCLDEMSSIGAIRQMREAPPFQIVRNWTDKFELLSRAYKGG